jgi:hypothetical protein
MAMIAMTTSNSIKVKPSALASPHDRPMLVRGRDVCLETASSLEFFMFFIKYNSNGPNREMRLIAN